jgi:cytochrome c
MKCPQLLLSVALILISQASLASDANTAKEGEALYKTHCSSCHGNTGGMDMQQRVAPPIVAVRMHYLGSYPEKDAFVMAVAQWVEKQDASQSLMRGAIRRFNIMPPISIAKEDAEKIAAYIFDGDIEKPAGFDQHFQERHGSPK